MVSHIIELILINFVLGNMVKQKKRGRRQNNGCRPTAKPGRQATYLPTSNEILNAAVFRSTTFEPVGTHSWKTSWLYRIYPLLRSSSYIITLFILKWKQPPNAPSICHCHSTPECHSKELGVISASVGSVPTFVLTKALCFKIIDLSLHVHFRNKKIIY